MSARLDNKEQQPPVRRRSRRHQKKGRGLAYKNATAPFKIGTESAELVTMFLLSQLPPVENADRLWLLDCCGLYGVLRVTTDAYNRVVFAFHKWQPGKRLNTFRRDREEYPYAKVDAWLTAPQLYAWLQGMQGKLKPNEYGDWSRRLQCEAGVSPYTLVQMPPPDDPDSADWWRENFGIRDAGGRVRLLRRQMRIRIKAIYEYLCRRWRISASKSTLGLPCCIKCANEFLVEQLRRQGIKAIASQVARDMRALDRAGLVHAAALVRRDGEFVVHHEGRRRHAKQFGEAEANDDRGDVLTKNYYAVLPGIGEPLDERTRTQRMSHWQTWYLDRRFRARMASETIAVRRAQIRAKFENDHPFAHIGRRSEPFLEPSFLDHVVNAVPSDRDEARWDREAKEFEEMRRQERIADIAGEDEFWEALNSSRARL